MIIAHIHLILTFVRAWWGPNFSWHKIIDHKTRQHGFLARHMPVRCFIQDRDLKNLQENWATNEHFRKFIQTFPQNETYTKEGLVSNFLEVAMEKHTKHFKQWQKKNIHLSLACDDPHVPQLISAWLLGIPPQHEPPLSFFSHTHKTNVCTAALMSFLTVDVIA